LETTKACLICNRWDLGTHKETDVRTWEAAHMRHMLVPIEPLSGGKARIAVVTFWLCSLCDYLSHEDAGTAEKIARKAGVLASTKGAG
jgi:hypothetical protein